MSFSDNFFQRVKNKTNVDKDTIINLANKLQNGSMKNEDTIKEVIGTLSEITGKKVTKEQEEKIIKAVMNNEIPNNLDKYYE